MIKAIKDYNHMVIMPTWNWLGMHWKGYLLYVAIVLTYTEFRYGLFGIRSRIKALFKKSEEIKP